MGSRSVYRQLRVADEDAIRSGDVASGDPYNEQLSYQRRDGRWVVGYKNVEDTTNADTFSGAYPIRPDHAQGHLRGYLSRSTPIRIIVRPDLPLNSDPGDYEPRVLNATLGDLSRTWNLAGDWRSADGAYRTQGFDMLLSPFDRQTGSLLYEVNSQYIVSNTRRRSGDRNPTFALQPEWSVRLGGETYYDFVRRVDLERHGEITDWRRLNPEATIWNHEDSSLTEHFITGYYDPSTFGLGSAFPGAGEQIPIEVETGELWGRFTYWSYSDRRERHRSSITLYDEHIEDVPYESDYYTGIDHVGHLYLKWIPLFIVHPDDWRALDPGHADTEPDGVFAYVAVEDLEPLDTSSIYVPSEYELQVGLNPYTRRIDSLRSLSGSSLRGLTLRVGDGPYKKPPLDLDGVDSSSLEPVPVTVRASFSETNHVFRGALLETTVENAIDTGSPPLDAPPDGDTQPGWLDPTKLYRASTSSKVILKHPLMPPGGGEPTVFDAGGAIRPAYRHGDYLVLEGSGPYQVYWNPEGGDPLPPASPERFESAWSRRVGPGSWSGVQRREEIRSRVDPRLTVLVGYDIISEPGSDGSDDAELLDVSPFVTEIAGGRVTLVGNGSIFDLNIDDEHFPRLVRVLYDGEAVYTGHLVDAQSESYANGHRLTLETLRFSEFHDVDLSAIDTESIAFPASENHYVRALLDRAGFNLDLIALQMDPEIEYRATSLLDGFWTAPDPDGPGFVEEEVRDIYRNGAGSGSSTNEVRQVLNANMLDLHDLPTGDLLVAPILPEYGRTIEEIFNKKAIRYGEDAAGNYLKEVRLDLSSVRIALDGSFGTVEVEGTSNQVTMKLTDGWANFFQQGSSELKPYFQASVPGSLTMPVRDTRGVWPHPEDWNYDDAQVPTPGSQAYQDLHANNRPWTFVDMQDGHLVLDPKPEPWYRQASLSKGDDTIEYTKISGGSRHVTFARLLTSPLGDLNGSFDHEGETITLDASNFASVASDLEVFKDESGTDDEAENYRVTLDTPTTWGIVAEATGSLWASATFEFKVRVPVADQSTIAVKPLVGEFNPRFAPRWLPGEFVNERIEVLKQAKPRQAKRVQNGYVSVIGSKYAVQTVGDPLDYDRDELHATNQLASWLTIKEFLKSRTLQVRFAGSQPWWPGQFIAVARRPQGGVGAPVTQHDILLILDPTEVDAQVGAEAWTSTRAAFICTRSTGADGEVSYEYAMQTSWSPTYGA